MTRDMTTAMDAALQGKAIRVFLLFEAEFPSGTVRLSTLHEDVIWAGQTWIGGGTLLSVSAIQESTDVVATGITVTLAGVDPSLVSLVISDAMQGLPGKVWLGLHDASGALIVNPLALFAGRLDVPQITDGAATCAITVSYENRLVDLNTPREWRRTHESQQQLYPGDMGFEFVAGLQDKEIPWGVPP